MSTSEWEQLMDLKANLKQIGKGDLTTELAWMYVWSA